MIYLLDTHVWLWATFEPNKLSPAVLQILQNNPCRVSVASIWELQIKVALGKLDLPQPLDSLVATTKREIEILSVHAEHALALRELAFDREHRDPFDRMLVAQAIHEKCELVTADKKLERYPVTILWAQARLPS